MYIFPLQIIFTQPPKASHNFNMCMRGIENTYHPGIMDLDTYSLHTTFIYASATKLFTDAFSNKLIKNYLSIHFLIIK